MRHFDAFGRSDQHHLIGMFSYLLLDGVNQDQRAAGEVRQGSEVRQEVVVLAARNTDIDRYVEQLHSTGLIVDSIDVEPTRIYNIDDARQFLTGQGIDVDAIAPQVEGKFMSAFIRAVKPSAKECCGPSCCS